MPKIFDSTYDFQRRTLGFRNTYSLTKTKVFHTGVTIYSWQRKEGKQKVFPGRKLQRHSFTQSRIKQAYNCTTKQTNSNRKVKNRHYTQKYRAISTTGSGGSVSQLILENMKINSQEQDRRISNSKNMIFRCPEEPGASLVITFGVFFRTSYQNFQGYIGYLGISQGSLRFHMVPYGTLKFLMVPQGSLRYPKVC